MLLTLLDLQAGVTVTTGGGAHLGQVTLTSVDTGAYTSTFSVVVNGTTYSATVSGTKTEDEIIELLRADIAAGKDVMTDMDFSVASDTGVIKITSKSKGSASSAFAIGKIKSNIGTSTALGAGVGTDTNATSVVTAMVRPNTSGYVRVANNDAGLAAAATAEFRHLGGASASATQLTSNGGTSVTTTISGDNENVVAAKDGTAQTNAADILAASIYEADHLVSLV